MWVLRLCPVPHFLACRNGEKEGQVQQPCLCGGDQEVHSHFSKPVCPAQSLGHRWLQMRLGNVLAGQECTQLSCLSTAKKWKGRMVFLEDTQLPLSQEQKKTKLIKKSNGQKMNGFLKSSARSTLEGFSSCSIQVTGFIQHFLPFFPSLSKKSIFF